MTKPVFPPAIPTATLRPPGTPPVPTLHPPYTHPSPPLPLLAPTYTQHHTRLSTDSQPAPCNQSSPTPCTQPHNPPEHPIPSPGVSKAQQKPCGPLTSSRDPCRPWQRPAKALEHSGGKQGPSQALGKHGKSCQDTGRQKSPTRASGKPGKSRRRLEGSRAPCGLWQSLIKAVKHT